MNFFTATSLDFCFLCPYCLKNGSALTSEIMKSKGHFPTTMESGLDKKSQRKSMNSVKSVSFRY